MSVEWYYGIDGKQYGPVNSGELKALADKGTLKPDDLVWKEGAEKWQSASIVQGLFEGQMNSRPGPPPLPQGNPPSRPISSGGSVKLGPMLKRCVLIGGVLFAVFILGIMVGKEPNSRPQSNNSQTNASSSDAKATSAAEERDNLINVARKTEGPFVAVIIDIVEAVESGDQPISVADHRMNDTRPDQHRYSRETMEAYYKWRKAWLEEAQ